MKEPEPVEDPVEDVEVVNPLSGRSMLVFGTSISWGSGNNGLGYSGIIAKNHDMVLHNYAVRGATIATVPDRGLILDQVKAAKSSGIDSDYVFLEGLANDAVEGRTTLGVMLDSFEGPFDMAAFGGALEETIKTIKGQWGDKKIIVGHSCSQLVRGRPRYPRGS